MDAERRRRMADGFAHEFADHGGTGAVGDVAASIYGIADRGCPRRHAGPPPALALHPSMDGDGSTWARPAHLRGIDNASVTAFIPVPDGTRQRDERSGVAGDHARDRHRRKLS